MFRVGTNTAPAAMPDTHHARVKRSKAPLKDSVRRGNVPSEHSVPQKRFKRHVPLFVGDVIEISSESEDESETTVIADLRKQLTHLQEVQ